MEYQNKTDTRTETTKPGVGILFYLTVYIIGIAVVITLLMYTVHTFSTIDYVTLYSITFSYGELYWGTAVILALLFSCLYWRGIKKGEFTGTLSIFVPAGILLLILANFAWGRGDFHTLLWAFNLGGMTCLSISRRIMLAGWLGLGNGLLLLCFNMLFWSDISQSDKWINAALLLCSVILLGLSSWRVSSRKT
jgi:hypothetical protein